jgi:cytochrome P450
MAQAFRVVFPADGVVRDNQGLAAGDTAARAAKERSMDLGERVKSRVVEPAVLRLCQWRGDPVARLRLPATKADPYQLYARPRQRGLVRSPLGLFAAADHATVATILRDRRFSSSPVHQRGYRPPSCPPGIQHCLGASLARLEGRIVIGEPTRRYPALELTAAPARRPLLVLRGFERVPVRASRPASQLAA